MSFTSTNPSSLFGGSWTQITDRFLYCHTSSGSLGGENSHVLTVAEMGDHYHEMYDRNVSPDAGTNGYPKSPEDTYSGNDAYARYWRGSSVADTITYHNTTNAGGGQAHNNMPPYITVYCWRRTAL